MRLVAALAVCMAGLGLTACDSSGGERTQVMVVVDAEPGVRERTEEVEIEVDAASGEDEDGNDWEPRVQRNLTPGSGVGWPLEIALVPRDDNTRRVYRVVATALGEDGEPVAEARAIGGYEHGKTLTLLLLFEDDCIDRFCDDRHTCRAGDCVDALADPDRLPDYQRDEDGVPVRTPFWEVDAGGAGAGDAGGEADAAIDAGRDGGTTVGNECEQHAQCNDRNACNGLERCVRNRCQAGTAFDCPALDDPCRQNVCVDDGGAAACEPQAANEGESCQAGDESSEPQTSCARDYVCAAGECEPQTVEDCVAAAQCEALAGCSPDEGCLLAPLPATTECDDGDPCTQDDRCSGTDASCAGVAFSCDDRVACTVDTCDGAGGCTHTPSDALCSGPCRSGTCDAAMDCLNVTFTQDFRSCDDSDAATSTDMCYRGECVGGIERAPSASCAVAGCDCSSFGTVRDLEFVGGAYTALIEGAQSGASSCTNGTVSIVYDVTPEALTPYATDTANGAISESSSDLGFGFVVSNTHIGLVNTTTRAVDWLDTPVGVAIAAQTPLITSFRGIARHFEGSVVSNRESHLWLWGNDTATVSTSRVVHCSSCTGTVIGGGCDPALVCSYGSGYPTSSIGAVAPYTNAALSTVYGGVLQLVNHPSGTPRKRVYEDGPGKDYLATAIEVDDADGAWTGALRLSGAGQVLVHGTGGTNLRVCTDATNSGDSSCVPITGLPNQSVRNYLRSAMGSNNTAVFMLANTGNAYFLLVLAVGVDPTVGGNWREIPLANSGTTVANAVAAGPTSFMVLGRSANVPYVWVWSP
jgi:hypothetical protein